MTETTMRRDRKPSRAVRRRRALVAVLVLLLVIALAVGGAAWTLFYRPQNDIAAGQPVTIEIPEGASTAAIAELLAEQGVIENANMFRLQSRMSDSDGRLKAGVYDMTTGLDYDIAIDVLTQGPTIVYFTVTIPEGYVIDQIAERLEEQAGIPAEEFLGLAKTGGVNEFPDRAYLAKADQGSLEGYLFPKTYRIREGSTAREVIDMMLDQFETEIATIDMAPADARGQSLHDIVTIASIIEREAAVAQDRPLVSSVIYNRLAREMRLEICATVEYVLPGNRFRLTNEDLQIESPYNSYKYGGLPPGPIASPGLAALQAAVEPAQTDYLYYVLTGEDGSHTFTATYAEFQQAKELSKEVFGE